MPTIDLMLLTIINQVLDDLSEPSVHFLVHAEYSFTNGTDPIYGPILLKQDLIDILEVTQTGINFKVHVNESAGDTDFLIRIQYQKIWKISRFYSLDFKDEYTLYMKR
jgi:hypothetical protein